MRSHRQLRILLGLFVSGTLVLTGCGGDDNKSEESASTTAAIDDGRSGESAFDEEARERFGVDGAVLLDEDGQPVPPPITASEAAEEAICEGEPVDLIIADGFEEIDLEGFNAFAMDEFCPSG